jgi:hypothetical protein
MEALSPFDSVELSERILKFVPTKDWFNYSLVSKTWYGRLMTHEFWNSVIPREIINHMDAVKMIGNPKEFVVNNLCRSEDELNQKIKNHIISNLLKSNTLHCFCFTNQPIRHISLFHHDTNRTHILYLTENVKISEYHLPSLTFKFKEFEKTFLFTNCPTKDLYSLISHFSAFYDFCYRIGDMYSLILATMCNNNHEFAEKYLSRYAKGDSNRQHDLRMLVLSHKEEFKSSCKEIGFVIDHMANFNENFAENHLKQLQMWRYPHSEYLDLKLWLPIYLENHPDGGETLSDLFSQLDKIFLQP